jgi:hypothetical protein
MALMLRTASCLVSDLHSIGTDVCNEPFAIPKFNIAAVHELLRFFDRLIIIGAMKLMGQLGKLALLINEKRAICSH